MVEGARSPTLTTVTAAAFVPASSTSTKVFWRTYWMQTSSTGVRLRKSASRPKATSMPMAWSTSFR